MIPYPRAVLFDWDNTLVDSWDCIRASYNRMFRHFGMPEWSMEEVHANVARSLRDSFPQMFGERWEEAREVFYDAFGEIHITHLKPFDGAETLLAGLAEAGIQAGVVSNKIGAFLRDEATALGWTGYFTHLVGAGDAEADKPHPAPVRAALAGGVPGPDVWFVGDSPIDMECAVKSGCTGILMRPHPPKPGEFDAFPPHRVFDSCAGLLAAVRGGRP